MSRVGVHLCGFGWVRGMGLFADNCRRLIPHPARSPPLGLHRRVLIQQRRAVVLRDPGLGGQTLLAGENY